MGGLRKRETVAELNLSESPEQELWSEPYDHLHIRHILCKETQRYLRTMHKYCHICQL